MIRFDGVYQAEEGDYYIYLRFFGDGTVITATSKGEAEEVVGWFQKGHPNVSSGDYAINGDELSFSTAFSGGTIEYNGQLTDEALSLRSYSPIDGFQDEYEYRFIELFTALFEGDPVYLRVRCLDVLRFRDGKESDAQEWIFYLRVPSAWAYSAGLQERATRVAVNVYDSLNWQAGVHREHDDGARYALVKVEAVILGADLEQRRPWAGQSVYELKPGEKVHLIK
jgi:hypothetical protein